ncbi:src kinase-associated phosphoprotein 1 [Elgaria multicarinata webbii]|uniref:src kinase-associated phosphoprotein 1 n=1 Tax=Elgaria multicarinata webbii TaxID=159646 RepID=UPI002FCCDB41
MQAAGGCTLPKDVQRLVEDVEEYLDGLQKENLSATAMAQRDEISFDIEQLRERYHWEFLPGGVSTELYSTQVGSDDSQTRNFTHPVPSEASFIPSYAEKAVNNTQKASQDQGVILKQGYLEKRSKDPKIFGSEWQKRWCILDNTTFYYYANEKSKQPKGMFAIENYHARLASHLRKDSRRDCCFELACPGKRTYEFTAVNPSEAMDWVDQILFLMKDMKSFDIPCEEEEDEDNKSDKEDAYDDIDSFDSPSAAVHQDTTLDLEGEETGEESEECIYEILPDEDLDFPAPDNREDAGNLGKTEGFIRHYANYYQGLWDCTSGHQDELSFQRGDLIYIISKEYNMYGWWIGELNSIVGIVPKDYLMPAYDVEER